MRRTMVCFLREDNEVILEKKLVGLPLREDFVIQKSIEFFDDPEPCMIHRSAVMKRVYMEFFNYLNELYGKGTTQVRWDELTLDIKDGLDLGEEPYLVEFCKKGQ